jgi:hypothetical protein
LPPRRSFGPKGSRSGSGDEVALKVEIVVDGAADTEEADARMRQWEVRLMQPKAIYSTDHNGGLYIIEFESQGS